jgi:hypothetical protein
VALLLASKTVISALITRRTIGFLAYREAVISSQYFELYLSSSLESQKKVEPLPASTLALLRWSEILLNSLPSFSIC